MGYREWVVEQMGLKGKAGMEARIIVKWVTNKEVFEPRQQQVASQ